MTENLTWEAHRPGRIEVVCGSMFSGKTEELIRRMRRAEFARQKVEIFKPAMDTRYSDGDVVSHDHHSIPSTPDKLVGRNIADVVGHRCGGHRRSSVSRQRSHRSVQRSGQPWIRVIVAGLDMDYKGIPFGPIPALCAIADDVTKVHAICVKCGSLAYVSHRIVESDRRVLLGETAEYEPLCRECYRKATAR